MKRTLLSVNIAFACAAFSSGATAALRVVDGTVVNAPPGITDSWQVINSGTLVINPSVTTNDITVTGSTLNVSGGIVEALPAPGVRMDAIALYTSSTATIADARVSTALGNAVILYDSQATISNSELTATVSGGTALNLASTSGNGSVASTSRATVTGSTLTATGRAIIVARGGELTVSGSNVTGTDGGGALDGIGANLVGGTMHVDSASTITGDTNGIRIFSNGAAGVDWTTHVDIDHSTITASNGSAILVDSVISSFPVLDANILVSNGSSLVAGNGVLVDVRNGNTANLTVDSSALSGDVVADTASVANLTLQNQASLSGHLDGVNNVALAGGSMLTLADSTRINSLALSGSTVQFAPGQGRSLAVAGDVSGAGGAIALHAELNGGGLLADQHADRLLIEGNVITTGTTVIDVIANGSGALTDTNQNGVVEAHEGISLVQVAGTSRADAFALKGGYVAAGPWQYTLHAFGPGQTGPGQSQLTNGSLTWDYRLGNSYVCEGDCTVDPEVPPVDPGNPGDPGNPEDPGLPETPAGRFSVVPQLPSYLSAPAALLTYGDMMNDGLHQRLGDIRLGTSSAPLGGEVFARYLGGQLRYSSNLSFQRYGYDFDQQVNALQLGGSLIALDGDNGTLRAGWAADHGTTRVTPKAVDGNSSAKYRANGISGWITWQHGNGLWVDGVVGSTRYRGDVGTDLRGADVGRLRANGWTMSVEAGMPIALGGDWTVEPRFQLKHQSLNFRDFTDSDGLDVKLGTAKQTSATLGGRLARTAVPEFMPYVGLDLTHTSNGDPNADVSNTDWDVAERFGSGRVGNSYRVAAGAVSQLGNHVQIYGEGSYQHFVGSFGMRGWAGNVGVRVTF